MKKFKSFVAEEMSVTLKQHGSTSYKVHSVGSKMKAHGGIKPGETVHDHHIDDLRDSGIKVRYHKEDVDVNEAFDKIGKSGEDHVYFTDTSEQGRKSNHSSSVKHSDSGEDQMHFKFKSHKIDVNDAGATGKKLKMSHVQQRVKAAGVHPDHHAQVSKHIYNHMAEAIERKADSKLIMVTDPNTGKTVLRKAPRKEIEIGKGKMESVNVNEKSAAEVLKKRYASDHPDDNPQATRKLKPGEHSQPKGANVYKRHPGAKLTDRGYSKKGKMAALKKQHARRPEQYGITEMEGAQRPVRGKDKETLDYSRSVVAQMRAKRLADKKKINAKEETVNERNTAVKMSPYKIKATVGKAKPIPGHPDYKGPANPKPKEKLNDSPGNMRKKANEETVNEISDTTKVNYINKANKQITDMEKKGLKTGQNQTSSFKNYKRRVGVRMAKSKLGEEEKYSKKEVRMGKGVAFDKRYKGGNMTGAYKTINKIKKGLGDHPKVRDALRRANEEFNKGE